MQWVNIRVVLKPSLTLAAAFDVQLQIEHTLQQLDILWSTHHVKGHQSSQNLTWEAQLNNRADALATEARSAITLNLAKKQ
eukprot:12624439-Ditylum_brightwellii.AAC.1